METFVLIILQKVLEAIYFSLFLILGKNIKTKRLLFTGIMIFEYLLLKSLIQYNVLFQFLYTFMSYINLKVLYKEKAQITDIFLFGVGSIILILLSMFTFFTSKLTYDNYYLSLVFNRILMFLFLYISRNKINEIYKKFYLNWNRHNNPNKIKSLTLRNISVIVFNLMFWVINLGMLYAKIVT